MEDDAPAAPERKLAKDGTYRGRPAGTGGISRLTREAITLARRTGRLPHEILLDIARGDLISQKSINRDTGEIVALPVAPTLEQRIDAAKACAPYYAPKISTVEVISGVANDELDHLIALAAAEAGFGLVASGEGEEGQSGEGEAGSDAAPVQQADGRRRRARLNT